MTTSTIEIVTRGAFDGGMQALSGATFERGTLADGRAIVLKHLPPEGDWLTRLTNGADRTRRLWEGGIFDRIADTVDHTVIGLVREEGHDLLLMEDATDALIQPRGLCRRIARHEVDRLMAGLAALHGAWEGAELDDLCTPAIRHQLLNPRFHAADAGPHTHPNRQVILAGWDRFPEAFPLDVVDAVWALHGDATSLEARMRSAPWTLLHGDAKPDNLGVRGDRLVAIDWGELTGTGPAAMDITWFAMQGTRPLPDLPEGRVSAMPDEVIAAYETRSSRPLDDEALDLACLGMVAQLGWSLAGPATSDRAGTAHARAVMLIDWWVARARRALETWSPA